MARAIFVRADSERCIEDVRDNATLRTLSLGQPGQVRRFLKEKADERCAQYPLAQSLLKEKRNKKGKRVNRVRPKDCGEWKLWGRRPLMIEKQAEALSGERS